METTWNQVDYKRLLVYTLMRAETRKQSVTPLDLSWEHVHQASHFLLLFGSPCSIVAVVGVMMSGLQINFNG